MRLAIISLIIQVVITFIMLCLMYMAYVLWDYEGGIDRIIGVAFIQPIIAIIVSGITIGVCLIIGSPIRFVKRIRDWWGSKYYIAWAGTILGLVVFLTSIFMEMLFLAPYAWCIVAFFGTHLYLPIINNQIKISKSD